MVNDESGRGSEKDPKVRSKVTKNSIYDTTNRSHPRRKTGELYRLGKFACKQ
jgi:hypothetical protein